MEPIARFGLESHAGPYERWPTTSRLVVDGAPLDVRVPGYVIEAQYSTRLGTLLVTSFDCPFEESNSFVLLDDALRVVARRQLLTPYASWLLDTHWPEDETTLVLHYHAGDFFRLRLVPPRRLWPRRPTLRLRRVQDWRGEPRMSQAYETLQARLRDIERSLAEDRVASAAVP